MFALSIESLSTNFKQIFYEALTKDEILKVDQLLSESEQRIFPPPDTILRAFNFFDIEDTKIVIIGQDPYHNEGEADGLCFSVPKGTAIPPSLRNVFSEVGNRTNTDLSDWAQQGVLLINTSWTVVKNKPLSHEKIWKPIFNKVFKHMVSKMTGVCFLLWGKKAEDYKVMINSRTNRYYTHTHPSPLSRAPFKGCGHFIKANDYLVSVRKTPIRFEDPL